MPLVTIVITLIVVGILLWLINTYIPMDGKIKKIFAKVNPEGHAAEVQTALKDPKASEK